MTRRLLPWLWAALLLVPALVVADDGANPAAVALRAAEEPLRDRDWPKAAEALRRVREQFPAAPEAIEAWVLEARALLQAGKARESVDAATAFLKAHGDVVWAGRMKATMSDAFTALAADADAARVLRERADVLTGDDHRAKIAALYVALADQDFDGREVKDDLGRPQKKKDFAQALKAYTTALDVGVAVADRLRVRARVAECQEQLGDHAGAVATWDALVKDAETGPGADPEAWLVGRGRARLHAGQGPEARKDLRQALEAFPSGKRHLEILRLLGEERFARAASAPTPDEQALAFDEGVAFLRRAIGEHREDPEAPAVQRRLAEAYESRGEWQKSSAEWRGLVERFPNDAAAPDWRNRLANALAAAGRWDEAVVEWKAFLSAFPNHPLWQEVQARIPQARFEKGAMLAAQDEKDAAIAAWRAFAEEYPTHVLAPEALVRVGALLRERKDFEGAIATWRGVTGRYAGSPQAPVAWFSVAVTLEDDLRRLEDAVKEYEELLKKHPGHAQAAERLQRLKGKHLEVRGERVIGSTDPAVLQVVTRNLPALKVRVYKLGLEDYFRRKHTIQGVEAIQVEIVKPDATAEWKVDPYAPFALVQAERPVPTTGPGAYVVVAGDDDLTSTTLLLVSDVETVVKSAAGRQVFVWARHRGTGEPVEGARVLVSDGSAVFAEGVTAKDGTYVLDTDRTGKRVLVVSGGSVAASEWEPGATFAEGWQSKAHVSTDRPVYRPGQAVRYRAIYRRADGGAYRVPAKAKGRAVLVNARGAEVERQDVVASDLGVFDGEFTLDGEAPLGDWAVRIDVDDRSFASRFRVLEYRKPEFSVAVAPEKPSYRTGEEVKATIRLTYTFGGPVVGAPVEWEVVRVPRDFTPSAVNDYSWYFQDPEALERARRAARTAPQGVTVARGSARTDDRGEAAVTFPTTERDEDAEYVVRASAVDVTRRFVVDEGRIPVVRRDHWAVVTADRRVYRPRQEMRATVQTVDANQSPVSRSGEVVLTRVRRTPVPPPVTPPVPTPPVRRALEDGKVRPVPLGEEEIEVQKVAVTTDKEGRAEVRLTLPGPGIFRARWVAKDGRGALVTAYAQFDVAGEAEDLSKDARLVASKETYTEGDRAEVLLQSPVTKVKALLTFEGEKVLAHRLVDVTSTSQILDVPVEGLYAPNVVLKVAIPAKDRLLEAEDEIVVFRYLKVEVTPSKATALPGEEVVFDVRTTDAAGAPVAAEVGVSVVDDALFAVAPDQAPAIRPFFYDRKRVNRVVTASSVGYRTYGTTRETNKDLLANAEAQSGDAEKVFAREALRIARAAMQRGDWDTAAQRALAATMADPESWDARNLLNEMRARPEAQESLKRFDDARVAEMRKAMESAKDARSSDRMARTAAKPGRAMPPAATPAPAPMAPGKSGGMPAEGGLLAPELADKNETEDDAPAQDALHDDEKKSAEGAEGENGVIGVGGGAGGKFKGRGGSRNLRAAGGGGRRAQEPAAEGYAMAAGDLSGFRVRAGAELGQVQEEARRLQVLLVQAQSQAVQDAAYAGQVTDLQRQLAAVEGKQLELQTKLNALQAGLRVFGDVAEPVEPALRKFFADTATWRPHVATDAQGRASVKAILPDNLTRWRATVRGIAGESLVGEGKAFLTARRDVLVRVDAPRFLVGGDEATIPTVVHNTSASDLEAQVKVAATGATLAGQDGPLKVPAGGRSVLDRVLSATDPGTVRIEASVTSPAGGDKVEAAFRTQPYGLRALDGRSGLVSTSGGDVQETFLEVPEGAIPGATRLVVALYPTYDAAILDALDFLETFPYGCVEQTVHRYLPAAWARRALAAVGSADAKRFDALDRTLRGAVGRLNNLQNPDGTFGWWRGGGGNVAMTALALLCYVEANQANVPGAGDGVNRTAAGLQRIVRSAGDDAQALAHWALALAGRIDEEAYQVTFRRRNEELSVAGLAWLSMAARALDREFDGDDLVRLILARKVEDADTTRWAGRKDDCFVGRDRLPTALAVRALLEAGVADPAVERGMRWLLANRPDGGPGTTVEAAAFVGACAAWVERNRPAAFGGTIDVLLDGKPARSVTVRPGGALDPKDRRFVLDVAGWTPGRHALSFKLSGQGEVRWAARLEATVAAKEIAADEHGVRVERLYLDADLPPVEGAEMPVKPGHEILRPSARPKVEAKSRDRAGTGERVLVRLTLTAPRDLQYVLVEDPLPAGFEVLDETCQGTFDWQERRDDRQVFFLSNVKTGPVVLSYVIQAVHLGSFAALPTTAIAMYAPEIHGRAAAHRFTVGAGPSRGTEGETPPTPDEVWALARRMLEKKQWVEAAKTLTGLKSLPLRDDVAVELEAALLRCALETKDAKEIVRAREELVRRDPGKIPTDLTSARAIASAYADVGAHPVAATLFRDLVARSFGMEAGWADTLRARGREVEGLAALGEALKAYPVSNRTAAAALQRATRYRDLRRPEGTPGKAGAPMDEEGLAALREVAAHYAETQIAGPASYAIVEALRRTRDLDAAVAEATAFPRRFPESPFVDDALFFLMDSRLAKFETAPTKDAGAPVLEAARRLTEERFRRPDGVEDLSEFRPRAFHATARVRHVLGDLEGAIAAYREAAGQIEDAREALAYLTEARLEMPESVTSGIQGKATFPLKYRNVGEVRFKAYPVDLQVLFAVRRTLEGLNRIDLSGIAPAKEWAVSPKDGGDHGWHETTIDLPLGENAAGVFLVVAKAGSLEASSVLVKTDLRVVLQSIGDKVRVHVTDPEGKGVRGAFVTVSDGQQIKARGLTDGRGMFEAPGVGPKPFVVASLEDRYATGR